jgi:NodT family efflux transporter outer membrane factor (OMF) lipoprotein
MSRLAPLSLAVTALVAGCAVGPNYHRPSAPQPAAFKEAWQPAQPGDDLPRGPWWQAYNDAVLDEFEASAEHSNQTIAQSEAAYRAALAGVIGARAALFPTITANASSTKSYNGSGAFNAGTTGTGTGTGATTNLAGSTSKVDRVSVTANWELDLWGGIRRQLEASKSSAQASSNDLAAVRLSIAAMLATSYVQLRALDVQRDNLARTVVGYKRSLEITQNRYKAGVAASTDVTQAEATLAQAETQDWDLTVQRATLEHAIATLAGKTPEEVSIAPVTALPTLPAVPPVLPATQLQRRPDVAAAERRVQAANAQIGVARAAYFPTLSLGATDGYQRSQWSDIISAPYRFWSVGPALAATLFDGGAHYAQNKTAEANYDSAVAVYRQAVLQALQDAEDALASLRGLADEEASAQRAAVAARDTLRATENQYRAGTVSYLNVVIAESTSLSTDTTLIGVQSRRLLAHVALLKAMGGEPKP